MFCGTLAAKMDLRSLRYFVAVVDAGSLSRAAGSLFVAQPALTAQIKKLEAELETQLLERTHAGVIPTPAGLQLYQDAQRLLADAAALKSRVSRLPNEPEGSVTIAMPFLLASLLSGPLVARLRQSHPGIRLFFIDDLSLMVTKAMLDGRADIGLLVDTEHAEGLVCAPLARESIYFCGRDVGGRVAAQLKLGADSERPEIDFARAVAEPLVMQSRRFAIRRSVEQAATDRGVALNIAHEHDSARVIRSLYLCGAGFTFTPACTLDDSRPRGKAWVVARVVNPRITRSYHLATPAAKPPGPVQQAVLDALVAEIRALIRTGRWQAELLASAAPRQG